MRISELGELNLIKKIDSLFKANDPRVVVPIGDDSAVLSYDEKNIVATTDLMAEHIHFNYSYTTFYQVGFKLISSNVSDIYAMGGRPSFALLNIAMSEKRSVDEFDKLLEGIKDACGYYHMNVVGGDISSTSRDDVYSATLIGFIERIVTRSGARTGDRIFVTGTLGDASAGLAYLRKLNKRVEVTIRNGEEKEDIGKPLFDTVKRHILPVARDTVRYSEKVSAMIDMSDGFLIDLSRLCLKSNRGAVIYDTKIPVSDGTRRIGSDLGIDFMDFVLSGGEDYEMIMTSSEESLEDCSCVGEIIDKGFYRVDGEGNKKKFAPEGYTHFAHKR